METLNRIRRALLALPALWLAGARPTHAGEAIDDGLALHLLNRLAYGPAPGELAQVRAMGVRAYVDSQLAPPSEPSRLAARLRELAHPDTPPGEEALLRAIASPRQTEAVLAAFWDAWFRDRPQKAAMTLRPHVLGRYGALVEAARGQGRATSGRGKRAALHALAGHFVTAPSQELLRALGRVWDANSGDQRAVLRALFTSREFLAPAQWNSMRKDAFRVVASAVRASGLEVNNVAPLMAFVQRPMTPAEQARFAEQLASGVLPLGLAPPAAHRYASSAPPLRITVPGALPPATVAQPGPVLMEAPTPSAAAMARAVRSQPLNAEHLRALLGSEAFLRY